MFRITTPDGATVYSNNLVLLARLDLALRSPMKKVSIATAQKLSAEGHWLPNPKAGQPEQPKQIFSCDYLIYWRPEAQDHAMAERISPNNQS